MIFIFSQDNDVQYLESRKIRLPLAFLSPTKQFLGSFNYGVSRNIKHCRILFKYLTGNDNWILGINP